MTENEIGKVVVDAAVKVHRELGHGLLETVYEVMLARRASLPSSPAGSEANHLPLDADGVIHTSRS